MKKSTLNSIILICGVINSIAGVVLAIINVISQLFIKTTEESVKSLHVNTPVVNSSTSYCVELVALALLIIGVEFLIVYYYRRNNN